MQLPLAYLDAAAIEEVPIEVWKDVFDNVGWPPSLASQRDSFGHKDILRSFAEDSPTDGLLQALEALHALGTETGREAIMAAIQDRRITDVALPLDKGDREFALRFYVAQRANASLADALVRAQTQAQEGGNQRRYNEFMAKEARSIDGMNRKMEALREEILSFCKKSDLGDHVHVETFEEDGIYVFNILRSHRTQKPLAVVPGHSARATIQFRPVHSDILKYDGTVGRLQIAVRASSMVEFYRGVLGKTLFNDDLLIRSIQAHLMPVLIGQGFEVVPLVTRGPVDREFVLTLPLGRLRRIRDSKVDLVEIDFARHRRAAFRINAGVAPKNGLITLTGHWPAQDLYVEWLNEFFVMYTYPRWSIWFSVWRWPWRPPSQHDYDKLAQRVASFIPELESALREGSLGPHMRKVVIQRSWQDLG
jgi:hypothetical protein